MGLGGNRDINKSGIFREEVKTLVNGGALFGNGAQPAKLVNGVGCKDGCVVHLFLTDADTAQLVTNDPDIFFCVLHTGRLLLPLQHDKEMLNKDEISVIFLDSGETSLIFSRSAHIPKKCRPGSQ